METGKTPNHVAIIPDGNRRWARKRGLAPWKGHKAMGEYKNLKPIIDEARKSGVKYFSAWGFSTENWKRSLLEKKVLFRIFNTLVNDFREDAHKEKTRFIHLGRKDRLPSNLVKNIEKLEEETKPYKDFHLILCLDYGGRDDILRAINKVLKSGKKKINEVDFKNFLDTKEIPDPDLIIRAGGDKRLSGFMSFQSAYSEFCFVKDYFPDFTPKTLRDAIEDFAKRKRTFGGN